MFACDLSIRGNCHLEWSCNHVQVKVLGFPWQSSEDSTGLIQGQGTKIPYAIQGGQKVKKKKKVSVESLLLSFVSTRL